MNQWKLEFSLLHIFNCEFSEFLNDIFFSIKINKNLLLIMEWIFHSLKNKPSLCEKKITWNGSKWKNLKISEKKQKILNIL